MRADRRLGVRTPADFPLRSVTMALAAFEVGKGNADLPVRTWLIGLRRGLPRGSSTHGATKIALGLLWGDQRAGIAASLSAAGAGSAPQKASTPRRARCQRRARASADDGGLVQLLRRHNYPLPGSGACRVAVHPGLRVSVSGHGSICCSMPVMRLEVSTPRRI